ncbi:hypothetical protein ACKAMS_26695 [Rhodococcus sp. 5A-K4]|uniref:hypothetical protein n=1 Tax=Rhodococcus sp. 5A-K4 TaxID=3384442 RepID=UPI00136C8C93|nr:hypothetical protein [Rhodococcus erythropolis]
MSAKTTRERGGAQTPVGLLILRPATVLLFTAVSIGVLLVLRAREPFVPPAQCYATVAAGSTTLCKDMLGQLEWVMWPVVVIAAAATIFATAHSVRLYFRNPKRTSS